MSVKVLPRQTPERDSRYMGLAWLHAGFSKDPNTQVGACIVSEKNYLVGTGYNGPPRKISDEEVIWERPSKDNLDGLSKYDLIVHAEINAIDHCCAHDLSNATLYVTALPCPKCMLEIVRKEISRVVFFDFQSGKSSSLQNVQWRTKSLEIANFGGVRVEKFQKSIAWIQDWTTNLKNLGVFEI
jgi:dCMP deaminase